MSPCLDSQEDQTPKHKSESLRKQAVTETQLERDASEVSDAGKGPYEKPNILLTREIVAQ